ncbi:hypothetical protein [Nonomuraea sp. LPB2021202275-12-8]|uniref:hypothetical protein n=1 Tax=Nonomuraea sp. LPB2021202275-12-8 TaxID=3120159 RepID=UPI00300C8486
MSKGSRLRARKKSEALSEQNLINGWSGAAGVRIRQARPMTCRPWPNWCRWLASA